MKGKRFAMVLTLLLTMSIWGCQAQFPQEPPLPPHKVEYPIQVKDQAGNVVTIQQEPKRIVSLMPSNTEILFALQLGEQVVGVTNQDYDPPEVKSLPKVGDIPIDVEKVLALKPDLVLASKLNGKETLERLKEMGLTVLVLDADSIRDTYRSIAIVGEATNRIREANVLIAKMDQEKLRIYQRISQIPLEKRWRVWIEISPDLYTAGNGTYLHELLTIAGGINVAQDLKGWLQVSAEKVLQWNPDVIITTYGKTDIVYQRSGWDRIKAVKNKRVYAIDPSLISRPGPRMSEAIRKIAEVLYPQMIKNEPKRP